MGLIGVKDGHGLLVEEVIEPKKPRREAVKRMGRNGRVFMLFLLFLPRCLLIQLPSDRSVSEELIYERWYM